MKLLESTFFPFTNNETVCTPLGLLEMSADTVELSADTSYSFWLTPEADDTTIIAPFMSSDSCVDIVATLPPCATEHFDILLIDGMRGSSVSARGM